MRTERAKALLGDPRPQVIEVAAARVYDSPSRLARVFRREAGVTPSEWRRERLNDALGRGDRFRFAHRRRAALPAQSAPP